MNSLQLFQFNDFSIEFELIEGQVYANATLMCKAFGKNPYEWMRLPNTIRYAEGLKAKRDFPVTLTISRKGGLSGGSTWIHEKLILKLAQWLDVDFEIWCDDRVSDFIKGRSEVALPLPSYQIDDDIERAKRWIEEQKQVRALQFENAELKPKAQYAEQVLLSETELTTTKVALDLGMSARKLNKLLEQKGVQYRQSGIWNLKAAYNGKGYAKLRTYHHPGRDGSVRTEHLLVWTETGRQFIHGLLNPALSTNLSAPTQLALA